MDDSIEYIYLFSRIGILIRAEFDILIRAEFDILTRTDLIHKNIPIMKRKIFDG